MDYSTVPFDGTAMGMLTVAEARARLAVTEPLAFTTFWTASPDIGAVYGKGWAEGGMTEPAPAWLIVPDQGTFQMTGMAARELASAARVPRKLQEFMPADLLQQHVTWALQEGLAESELKLLTAGLGRSPGDTADVPLAVAQTRATVEPFSNVQLLDTVLLAIRAGLGSEAADSAQVDYKFWHDLEHTSFRVVIPNVQQPVDGDTDHTWCYGVEVSNSLIGLKQTVVSGYLFQLGSTAGITDVERSAGGFKRRGSTPEAAYAWAGEAVGYILAGRDEAFSGLQGLSASVVDGDYPVVLDQLFHDSPVAKDLKLRIIATLEDAQAPELTMYDLACAAAEAANLDDTTWREARSLFDLAGHILHQGGGMCDGSLPRGCRRLLPEGMGAGEAS